MLEVFYDKKSLYPYALLSIASGAWGLFELFNGQLWLGLVLILLTLVLSLQTFPKLLIHQAQIVVDHLGIHTPERGQVSWKQIRSAQISMEQKGKSQTHYLDITYKRKDKQGNSSERISLKELAVEPSELQSTIDQYK